MTRLFTFALVALLSAGCMAEGDDVFDDVEETGEAELELYDSQGPSEPGDFDPPDERVDDSSEGAPPYDPAILFEPVPEPWSPGGGSGDKK